MLLPLYGQRVNKKIEFILDTKLYECYPSEVIADLISECGIDLLLIEGCRCYLKKEKLFPR